MLIKYTRTKEISRIQYQLAKLQLTKNMTFLVSLFILIECQFSYIFSSNDDNNNNNNNNNNNVVHIKLSTSLPFCLFIDRLE